MKLIFKFLHPYLANWKTTLAGIGMVLATAGLLTPVQAALLQEGIDLLVILNALRALRVKGVTRP
jgi:cation transport ATPase